MPDTGTDDSEKWILQQDKREFLVPISLQFQQKVSELNPLHLIDQLNQ